MRSRRLGHWPAGRSRSRAPSVGRRRLQGKQLCVPCPGLAGRPEPPIELPPVPAKCRGNSGAHHCCAPEGSHSSRGSPQLPSLFRESPSLACCQSCPFSTRWCRGSDCCLATRVYFILLMVVVVVVGARSVSYAAALNFHQSTGLLGGIGGWTSLVSLEMVAVQDVVGLGCKAS